MTTIGRRWVVRGLILLTAAGASTGCLAAAAAAGAGTGIYLTTRGAEAIVNGAVGDVAARTRSVFAAEGISVEASKTERSGDKQELKGKKGDLDVTATLQRESATTTKVEVTARKNLAEWDKSYAQDLLNRIVKAES